MNKLINISLIFTFIVTNNLLAKFYSQIGQDKFIYENFFKTKKNGVFIDIGAHDGITLSNTAFFEKELGWTGICIEPLPTVFEKLTKNRSCICINGCIDVDNCQKKFLAINGYPEMLSGLIDRYDPKHLSRINYELQEHKSNSTVITVDCYRLNDLLDLYDIQTIDYLSIDTEGGELDILRSIDFDKVSIHIIDVENNYNDPNFKLFLTSKGYQLITHLGVDEIYQKV